MVTTEKILLYLSLIFFFVTSNSFVSAVRAGSGDTKNDNARTALFVFGDSYVDTGNEALAIPYGITFPGKPAGRFSDGRVFTDYVARFVGVKSPIAYRLRKYARAKQLRNGMNFAYGGSGVFDTMWQAPNTTTQIDLFQQLINNTQLAHDLLHSSMALVSQNGNDYYSYLLRNGTLEGIIPFITRVVNQVATNMKRIRSLGVKKVAASSLPPLGCLPNDKLNFTNKDCNEQENMLVNLHNLQLQEAVAKLNNGTKDEPYFVLDLYQAFITVIKNKGDHPGSSKFKNPLKPCCVGVSSVYNCASVDDNGAKKYTVCDDPGSSIYWDIVHPTQAGWKSVYLALRSSLQQLKEKKTN